MTSNEFSYVKNSLRTDVIYRVSQKAERSIFVTLIFENIAYFDFIR